MIVLLPEGRAVCNADSVKLVKVVPNNVQGVTTFVVVVKLDDDAELMIKTVTSEEDAYTLANRCADLLNSEEGAAADDFDDFGDTDDSAAGTGDSADTADDDDDWGDDDSDW